MAEDNKENGFVGSAEGESAIGVHSREKKRSGQEVVTVNKDNVFKFCSKDTHKKSNQRSLWEKELWFLLEDWEILEHVCMVICLIQQRITD